MRNLKLTIAYDGAEFHGYAAQKCALIFPNRGCKPNKDLLRIARRDAKQVGVTARIELHRLRRTAECAWAGRNSIELVRQLLGHPDLQTTQTYLGANAADVQRMHTNVDETVGAFGG
ncbi:MAG: tyrosine-type recombinase/integrase [Candidatus Acidiferrales bacterium]